MAKLAVAHVAAGEPDDLRRHPTPLLKLDEVVILRENDSTSGPCAVEEARVLSTAEIEVEDVDRLDLAGNLDPLGRRGGNLGVDPDEERTVRLGHLRSQRGMVQAACSVTEAGCDIVGLEIGVICENLSLCLACREKFQYVDDADPHPADARAASALVGVHGDPVKQVRHGLPHPLRLRP